MIGCEGIAALAMFCALAKRDDCLPQPHRYLWPEFAAMAQQESGMQPWALRDETMGRAVPVRNAAEARAYVALHPRHSFGAGLMQITGPNLIRYFGRDWVRHAFDPCASLRAGALHFVTENLPRARAAYNGGGAAAARYAVQVSGRVEQITGAMAQPVAPVVVAKPGQCGAVPPAWDSRSRARHRACIKKER